MEISEIDRTLNFLEKYQKRPFQTITVEELGSILGCQALVYGEVTEFTKVYAGIYSQIGIGAKIKIIDTKSGQTVWEDSFVTRFHEGGIPFNPIDAVFSCAKTGLNLRTTQELRAIDDLCRNLVARIPKLSFSHKYGSSETQLCEIQIAAFKDFKRALALRKILREKKYQAFVRTVDEEGIIWHRVLMGPFDCGEETDWWEAKIANEFKIEPFVIRIQN